MSLMRTEELPRLGHPEQLSGALSRTTRLRRLIHQARQSPAGITGIAIVLAVLAVAVFGQLLYLHDPGKANLLGRFQPPGFRDQTGWYPLGTDQLGRDIYSRMIAGARVSVIVGVMASFISGVIGVIYGIVAGFIGGSVDLLLMRIVDALLGIPFIILVVAISGTVGPGLATLILVLSLTNWVSYARVVRGEVLVIKRLEYITAARAIGQSSIKIMLRHVLPNAMTSAIVLAALQVGVAILAESALSFLGLGVQPPAITWGLMLADGKEYIGSAWWMTTFPGIAITITVLGVVFLGDWLRDVLDPRLHA